MNDNSSYREKGRAVFLAAIMVLSVVAMSAAFAGSAAAVDDTTVELDDTELDIDDGDTQSQEVTFNLTPNTLAGSTNDQQFNITVADDNDYLEASSVNSVSIEDESGNNVDESHDGVSEAVSSGNVEVGLNTDTNDIGVNEGESIEITVNFDVTNIEDEEPRSAYYAIVEDDSNDNFADFDDYDSPGVEFDIVDSDLSSNYGDDVSFTPEGFVFQGQLVTADVTHTGVQDEETVTLRSIDDTDSGEITSSSFEEELEVEDDNGQLVVTIATNDLEDGDYFLRDSGDNLNETTANSFEVGVQSLDIEFDDETVTDAGDNAVTEFDIDSDRGTYTVNVSADGDLDDEELFSIFTEGEDLEEELAAGTVDRQDFDSLGTTDAYDTGDWYVAVYNQGQDDDLDHDEKIALVDVSDTAEDVDFTDIDVDEYEFTAEVTDSDAEASTSIEVVEEDVSGDFSQGVYTQSAGDLQQITLELEDTDEAYIQIGDEDAGFVDVVHVEDGDDNGEVSFWINTRLAGTPNAQGVYVAPDDDIDSLLHGGLTNSTSAGATGDVNFWDEDEGDTDDLLDFDEYVDELGIAENADDQLTRPLQPTDYSLTADAGGDFIVDDGESEANDELDAASLELTTPQIGEVNTHVAPSDDADEDDEIADLLETVTERSDIAMDDRLIIEVEASGLYGALAHYTGDGPAIQTDGVDANSFNALLENDGEGINFEVEADDGIGNQDPTTLDLGDSDVDDDDAFVLVNNAEGAFYVIVDTSSGDAFDGDLEDGQTFTAEFEYETDDDERYAFNESGALHPFDGGADGDPSDAAYPYFGTDSTESVSADFDIVEPAVEFNNLDADDNVQIETSDDAVVTGETNVAPGSDADIRIRNAGDTPSFLSTQDATIDSDGTFESEEFEFAERAEDDEADIEFRVGGSNVDSADGIFVEAVEETDDEPPEEDDEPPEEDDEPPETDDDPEPPETDDDPEPPADDTADDTADDGVPGFGLAIAVVALLAAAMLALRRQN